MKFHSRISTHIIHWQNIVEISRLVLVTGVLK